MAQKSTAKPRTKKIPILLIRQDSSMQPRARLDEEAIADYAAAYKAGAKLPPLEVYWINRVRPVIYHVTDGWHRLAALRRCGAKEAACVIHNGTLIEAQWAAIGANQTHGLRRTTADKERAVRAALRHPMTVKRRLSDRRIAEHVGVDPKTVAKYRAEMQRGAEIPHLKTRQGKDGKTYQVPDKKTRVEAPELALVPKQISGPPAKDGDLVRCRCCGRDVEPDGDGDCPKCHEPRIQDDLDAYAAERGWQLHETNQPVAAEEPPTVVLEDRPEWIVEVERLAHAAIDREGLPAVAGSLQRLVDQILMEG